MRLVECVPNFSEGRDRRVIDAIAAVIASVDGVRLLDVDPGMATNRTVFTFVGPAQAVAQAAFLSIELSATLIDMRAHKGAHPRIGAADVVPFVPLGATTMQECVELAERLGRRVGDELKIPVYLYEAAASRPERRSLSEIRKGEYEGLPDRLKHPDWAPDFGPARSHARAGAVVIGAREFLIAYNVNLNTRDRKLANVIAQNIRETGRPKRGPDGKVLKDSGGQTVTEAGPSMLPATRATGWYIEEYGRAQVSINLTDYRTTPPHRAFAAVEAEAAKIGLRVTGSEVVGLIPLEAIRMAGRDALLRQGKSPAASDAELLHLARMTLGLDEVSDFDPDKKVIERSVAPPGPLARGTVEALAGNVSSATPAPGGGSVAALCGSLSAALTAMVAGISYEHKGFESRRESLAQLGAEAQSLCTEMLAAMDEDTAAFNRLMEANRRPRATEQDRLAREEAIREATRGAIDVPLAVMKQALRALELAELIARQGAQTALSDAGVAALAAAAAVEGAYYNVRINLRGLADPSAPSIKAEATALMARMAEVQKRVGGLMTQAL
jgi:glutamate formiminotransferase/formiminotetrahydrofolate cyclodeaminase